MYRKVFNKVPPEMSMKIIKVLSKKVGDTEYQKYLLNQFRRENLSLFRQMVEFSILKHLENSFILTRLGV